MKSSPWVKWFSADFLNGISDLEPNEIAVYSVVLNLIYDNEGPIADDATKIGRRCNMRQTSCEKALASLAAAAKITRTDGRISNHRCEKEMKSRQKVSDKSAEIANVRWKKEAEKPKEINEASMPAHSPSNATAMLSLSLKPEPEKKEVASQPKRARKREASAAITSEFELWWPIFPNKVGKDYALLAFDEARKKTDLQTLIDGVRRYVANKPPDRSWCNPATWLNQGRWKDEPANPEPVQQKRPNGGGSRADSLFSAGFYRNAELDAAGRDVGARHGNYPDAAPRDAGSGEPLTGDILRPSPERSQQGPDVFADRISRPVFGARG